MKNTSGITLPELIIVITIIGILAVIVGPELGSMRSNYNLRSCATDLIQNMRVARAMAIKENRSYLMVFDTTNDRYLIGFDGDSDNNLITANFDTFGICKDTDSDRLPNGDTDGNGDNVPDCVRVISITNCGNGIDYGTPASTDPAGNTISCNGKTACFGSTTNPIRAEFNPDGSVTVRGSVYLQHTTRGYSYNVRISNTAGAMSVWKWDGDADNTSVTTWTEIR
jgi:prepilin-type N-terminal cleavage/methylation domain-containing protein